MLPFRTISLETSNGCQPYLAINPEYHIFVFKSLKSDGQQFHQYPQNEQHLPPQTIEMQKKREAWLTHDIVNLIFFVNFAVAATYYVISGFFSAFSTM